MFSILTSKIFAGASAALLILAGIFWLGWTHAAKDRDELRQEAGTVVIALREASNNPDLKWRDAAGQVIALGAGMKDLKSDIADANMRIDQMAQEAVRLRARADELQEIADRAKAQRQSALRRLSEGKLKPGTRADCLQLVKEANDALDLVYSAGL